MTEISSSELNDYYDDCILYELLVYSEWKQDPELLKHPRGNDSHSFGISYQSSAKYFLQYFRKQDLSDEVRRILLRQLPWQFAVGEGGKVVAILQDTVLEIRTSRDEYSSIIGKASIAKDIAPQWRKLSWSPDCSMLAVGHSNGVVSFYDLLGSNLFNIYPQRFQENQQQIDKNTSLAYLGFIQSRRRSPKWSAELVLVDFQGNLHCYMVSPTEGYQESHSFSFAQHYPNGITAVSYHPTHNMLFIAGPSSIKNLDVLKDHGSYMGLSAWRLLNDYPYCILALSTDEEQAIWQAQRRWWNWIPSVTVKNRPTIIFKMQVSPGGKFLACLHSCGSFSIWHLPAIRLYKFWNLQEQPDYNVRNPLDKRRSDYSHYSTHPVDVNWWSDHAVIIARHSGAISVCSVGNLNNLLGDSPEFLAGPPQVSALCSDRGFLGLECESILTSKKWPWDEYTMISEMESSDDNEDDSDAEASLLNKSSALLQTAVYVITDIERFQPKKKKPKLCYRTYRLLGLKSTTPDELYARKIDNEEYGEALALAKAYNLDCDLVYQRQWRNNKVSVVTIHDYLSKVTKRTWVLKECVERVPETFGAAQELLQFGLRETNAENLFEFDDGELLKLDDSIESDAAEGIKKIEDALSKISLNDLTPEQQTLVRYRQQLLEYCDRLITYELIMGGPHMAEDYYDYVFYDKFRTVSLIESTVKFARESNWKAVEIMFTYHGEIILPHWLPVLSNFPETLNPQEYRSLLPECDTEGHLFQWSEIRLRSQDWCEKSNFWDLDNKNKDVDSEFIYEEDDTLRQFICSVGILSGDSLTCWFLNRVNKIESQGCMVDHALSLTKLARERNITGLENLYNQLLTLDTMVYDVHLENVRLTDIQKMSQLDICKLLMSKSSEATFVDDLKHILLPFLLRCEKTLSGSRKHLLHAYLTELSSHGLSLPLKLFDYVHNENPNMLVPTLEEKMSLALSSIYAYPNCDQLSIAFLILQYIPERSYGGQTPEITALQNKLNELECDLHAAEILERNSICKPLSFIQDNKSVVNVAQQLLVRLARNIAKKIQPPTENEWVQLLNDICDLQKICFSCISIEACFEIYVASILSSGYEKNIRSAVDLLECQQVEYSNRRISYKNSVKLVWNAAMEYFDSASSIEDPAMDLARTCLSLITDENEDIKGLQDLIGALQLLSDFGISMLPLQVRLSTERLKLVRMSIQSKPTAYRNKQKLFQLANKLQVCGKDLRQRQGKVLVLIAEAALEALDYQFCAEICQELVSRSHTIGWQVVQKLGQCEDFDNFPLRCELLGFALLFCPDDLIEELVHARCSLEVQLCRCSLEVQLLHEAVTSDEEEFSDALTSPITPSKEFQTLLNIIEDAVESVKNTVFISPTSAENKNLCVSLDDSVRSEHQTFEQQGFPAFYSELQTDCHISCYSTKYDRFADPDIIDPVVKVSQAFLRILQLKGTISHGKFEKNSQVLLQISEKCFAEDASLGLAYMLPIDDLSLADTCFSRLICSSLALELAAYFYSLKGYKEIQHCTDLNIENQRNIYYIPAHKLIEHMCHVASKLDQSAVWADLLMKYQKLIVDFQQGEKLQNLGCGVDLERFTHDAQYQQDSILGLAMTVDAEKFSLAIMLASHHGIELGEVVARHLASLLLNTEENQNSDVAAHLTDSKLAELIKISPHLICERLFQYAYPNIEGSDHRLLLSYFSVIQTIAEDYTCYSLTPKEHIKLIRKVKTASSDIDYKKLVDSSYNILDVVIPALQRNNIGMIAKLLKSLPPSLKCMVEPGKLYSAWAQKEFFKVSVPVAQASQQDWLEQYELCKTCFNKMAASDVVDFVKGTCFSEQGVNVMTSECREIIVTRAKENCQIKIYPMEDEVDEWNDAVKMLDCFLTHLKIVRNLEAEHLCTDSDESRQFIRLFDLSRGDTSQLDRILQMIVTSNISADSFRQFVTLLPHTLQTFELLLTSLLKTAIGKFKCRNGTEEAKLLYGVLQRIQENLKHESSVLPQEVETLCGDPNLTPEIRLKALEILQSLKPHAVRSDITLLYRQTQATVASGWAQVPVTFDESDLATEESRRQLFSKLLQHASAWRHLLIMKDLFNNWPPFSDVETSKEIENPWVQLTHRILISEDRLAEEAEIALEEIFRSIKFSTNSIVHLVSMAEGSTDASLLLLLCLLPNEPSLNSTVYTLVHKHMHANNLVLSNKLLSLLLYNGLASTLITTPAYRLMIEYLLENYSSDINLWKSIINQLVESGHYPEAGMLQLLQMGVSSSLNVFSAALSCIKSTLSEE